MSFAARAYNASIASTRLPSRLRIRRHPITMFRLKMSREACSHANCKWLARAKVEKGGRLTPTDRTKHADLSPTITVACLLKLGGVAAAVAIVGAAALGLFWFTQGHGEAPPLLLRVLVLPGRGLVWIYRAMGGSSASSGLPAVYVANFVGWWIGLSVGAVVWKLAEPRLPREVVGFLTAPVRLYRSVRRRSFLARLATAAIPAALLSLATFIGYFALYQLIGPIFIWDRSPLTLAIDVCFWIWGDVPDPFTLFVVLQAINFLFCYAVVVVIISIAAIVRRDATLK